MTRCIDCIHYRSDTGYCDSRAVRRWTNPVTGSREIRWPMAESQRQNPHLIALLDGSCGRRGRFFQAKGTR